MVLLTSSSASADITVLETQLELRGGDRWQAIIYPQVGDMQVTVSISQGLLNFTIYQNNLTMLSIKINAASGVTSQDITVLNPGPMTVTASVTQVLSDVEVNISLTQSDPEPNNFILAGGIVLFLAIPVIYIIGRNQGLKQL